MLTKLLKKLSFVCIFTLFFLSQVTAFAQAPASKKAVVKSSGNITAIKLSGQKKIEEEAILSKLISKVGDGYSEEKVAEDIQAIFKMGYFVQIEVLKESDKSGLTLIYKLVEKPTLTEIVFEGNEDVKSDDLLEQVSIKAFEIFNYNKIAEAVTKLEKFYEEKGFYLVKIEPKVEDIDQDTVRLKFIITENDKVKVQKISFIGNKQMKESVLKSRLSTQEAGFFTALSSSGSFKQDALENDMNILKYTYWNEGYINVKLDRPVVTVTPDKKSIYITFHIDEGEQYSVGEVDFAGDLLFEKSELLEIVKIKDSEYFSVPVMQKDISDLQAKYGDLGYAFTNVIPRYNFNEAEKKVDLVFEFEKGSLVYFGTIDVVDNTKTRDKVVRRELKIREGELYNETRKRQSQANVQRLGFFDEVNFKTSTPPEKPDQLNIEIAIKERNTGQLQLNAGYGSIQGLSLGGSIQQNNFRGLGQSLGVRIEATKSRQEYSVNFTEPYFYDTTWSSGFSLYYIDNKDRINYDDRHAGASIRFGRPIWGDDLRAFLQYKIDKTDLFGNQFTDPLIFPLETARGVTSSARLSFEYDTRNDRMTPSEGVLATISYEYAGLGGDLHYQEISTGFNYFKNIFWDVVWRNNLSLGVRQSLNGEEFPFTKTYQMGGAYSLRGFGSGTVGKRIFSQFRYNQIGTNDGNPFYNPFIDDKERTNRSNLIFGGTKQALIQTELQYPIIKDAGLSGVFFYDMGQAEDEIDTSKFLSDFGMGFRWQSPLGLLRFEWGWPLQQDDLDRDAVNFEFSIGPPF